MKSVPEVLAGILGIEVDQVHVAPLEQVVERVFARSGFRKLGESQEKEVAENRSEPRVGISGTHHGDAGAVNVSRPQAKTDREAR